MIAYEIIKLIIYDYIFLFHLFHFWCQIIVVALDKKIDADIFCIYFLLKLIAISAHAENLKQEQEDVHEV